MSTTPNDTSAAPFAGAIDLYKPIGSASLRIRQLEADAGLIGSAPWKGHIDPWPWYQEMRASNGGVHLEPGIGVWMSFRYHEVQRVLADQQTYSSAFGNLGMQNVDAPLHRKLRLLVTFAFTPKRVDNLSRRIREITDDLIDGFASAGSVDIVKDFTQPLSTTVIAELLGIPSDDHNDFRRWTDEVSLGAVSFADGEARPEAPAQMAAYFTEMIAEARRHPGEDLITALLQAEVDGEKLSDGDIFNFCVLLLVAGNETTGNLIANAVRLFSEYPESRLALREDPDLLGPAIEEILRFRGPIQSMIRIAKEGARVGDHEVEPGTHVLSFIGSANRDPEVFDDPETFDIRRKPNRHIAFGHGSHFCLGAPLARLETRTAITTLTKRLGEIEVNTAVPLEPLNSRIFYGLTGLPATFTPAEGTPS